MLSNTAIAFFYLLVDIVHLDVMLAWMAIIGRVRFMPKTQAAHLICCFIQMVFF